MITGFIYLILYILLTLVIYTLNLPIIYLLSLAATTIIAFLISTTRYHRPKNIDDAQKTVSTSTENENALNKELDMARRVQQGLLNTKVNTPEGLTLGKRCIPAQSIGGDFYAFRYQNVDSLVQKPKMKGVFEVTERNQTQFSLCLGDVAGHGISSALVMALASGILSEMSFVTQSPAEILNRVNTALKNYLENSKVSYVTAFYGVINLDSKTLTYAKGGHPPGYILSKNGALSELDAEGVILGMFDDESFEEKTIQLQSGDRVILYTDGIIEAEDRDGKMYGQEKLENRLKDLRNTPVDDAINTLLNEVDDFANHTPSKDDQTLVIIELE